VKMEVDEAVDFASMTNIAHPLRETLPSAALVRQQDPSPSQRARR